MKEKLTAAARQKPGEYFQERALAAGPDDCNELSVTDLERCVCKSEDSITGLRVIRLMQPPYIKYGHTHWHR